MLTHKDVEDLMPLLEAAILDALKSVGEDAIKAGPFFGVGEYHRGERLLAA